MSDERKNRKMKLNKAFTPVITEDDDECFPNGIFDFNITKLLAFIHTNPARFPVEMIQISTLPYQGSGEHLNEDTITAANLSNPIILAEISPGRFNVIDGNHRLERARREGAVEIPAYRVTAEQHVPFMKTFKGYQAYVGYWNEKLQEASEQ